MDLSHSTTSKLQAYDKICISRDCNAENPYIDPQNQQIHEHNGVISAVRVGKVREIHHNIMSVSNWVQETKAHLQNVKNRIVHLIDEFIKRTGKDFTPVGDMIEQLELFLEGQGTGKFGEVWGWVKQNIKDYGVNEQIARKQSLRALKNDLIRTVEQNKENLQQSQTEGAKAATQDSQFLKNFSDILTFLNLQLKSKLSESTLAQLRGLKPTSKSCEKLTAKIYQICNQTEQAISIYDLILKQNSLDTEALARKCLLLKKTKRYQEAYDELILLIDLIQSKGVLNDKFYHFQKAQICRALGKYKEAERELEICQGGSDVKKWKVERQRGHLLLKQEKIEDAVKCYQNALKSEELNMDEIIQINESLLECSQTLNNNKLGIESLTVLHRMKPTELEYLFKRGRLYHLEKQYQKAAQDYSMAIERVQNIPGLYYNRAVELIYSGQSQSAIPDLKKAIELDPNFKEAVHLLANTCFDLFLRKENRPDVGEHLRTLAISTYGYCLNFYPTNHSIWHNLGILETNYNSQKAYDYFFKAIEINPNYIPSYLGKIKTAIKLHKDYTGILKDINTAIQLGDRTTSTYLIKAAVEEQLNLASQSLQSIEAILKVDPMCKQAHQIKQRLLSAKKEKQPKEASLIETDEIKEKND